MFIEHVLNLFNILTYSCGNFCNNFAVNLNENKQADCACMRVCVCVGVCARERECVERGGMERVY